MRRVTLVSLLAIGGALGCADVPTTTARNIGPSFAFRATAYLTQPDRLNAVTVPVTIVSAEDDKLVDNAAQAAAARHLPQEQVRAGEDRRDLSHERGGDVVFAMADALVEREARLGARVP